MMDKVLKSKLMQLEKDTEVAIRNLKPGMELSDMINQTGKAMKIVFTEASSWDEYFALLDVINQVDKFSDMDLRNDFFVGNFSDPEMQIKFSFLFFIVVKELLIKLKLLHCVSA